MVSVRAAWVMLVSGLISGGLGVAQASDHPPFQSVRSAVVPIKDSNHDWQYELYIRLPEDYDENAETQHPVVYTSDGLWHFETLAGTIEYVMPNAIFVAISWQTDLGGDRPHASRFRDYTVLPSTNPEVQAQYNVGQAANHLTFIRDDVIPYIEENYRADPEERTYFGFSLGGLFGSYVVLAQPDTFQHYILGSPSTGDRSFGYFEELIRENASARDGWDAHVYLTVGELEEEERPGVERLATMLRRFEDDGLSVTGPLVIENSGHSDSFPATSVGGIKWLADMTADESASE